MPLVNQQSTLTDQKALLSALGLVTRIQDYIGETLDGVPITRRPLLEKSVELCGDLRHILNELLTDEPEVILGPAEVDPDVLSSLAC